MAGLIKREDIDAVRERADLREVIEQYVTLKKAGIGSYKGLCPFHDVSRSQSEQRTFPRPNNWVEFHLQFVYNTWGVVCVNGKTEKIVSVSEANQNFSRVAQMADKSGEIVIFKNNKPKYLLVDPESDAPIEMTDDEKIDFVAARILREYRRAFEALAN